MSEDVADVTPDHVDAESVVGEVDEPLKPGRIPKERLDKEIQKRRALEAEAAELRERLEALEDAGKSEAELTKKELKRLQEQHAETTAEKSALESRIRKQERSALIRAAADTAGFLDADVAIALSDLDEIEDEHDAKQAVKRLLEAKPHLAKPKERDAPELRKVFGAEVEEGITATKAVLAANESKSDFYDRIYGQKVDVWTPEWARAHGGGVGEAGGD